MQYRHEDWDCRDPPLEKPVFGAKYLQPTLVHSAIVRLTFKKGGNRQAGNGFFVNIPGAKKFVLTAGHNLVSAQPHTDIKVRLFKHQEEIPISNDHVRVSSTFAAEPTESSADHDYGVILLPDTVEVPGNFGFSLHLGVIPRLDADMFVTGYRAGSASDELPVTSNGPCVNPILHDNRLEYRVETEAGFSGAPVWVGYKTHPTVVAIHNYGPEVRKPGYGSRGTRLNPKMISEVFAWTGVEVTDKILCLSTINTPQQLPLRLTYSSQDGAFGVIVGEHEHPFDTMRVRVFPMYAPPSNQKQTPGAFACEVQHEGSQKWISWNVLPNARVTLVDDLCKAVPVRIEGKEWNYGGEFAIVVPPSYRYTESGVGTSIQGLVAIFDHGKLARDHEAWRLQEPGEVLYALDYCAYYRNRRIKDAYDRWVLKRPQ